MFIDLIVRFSTVAAAEALPSDIYNYHPFPFDPVYYVPLLTHAVLVANADYRPALAANLNGSPSIVNWDTRTLQRVYLYQPVSQFQARPRPPPGPSPPTQPSGPILTSTQAPTLHS
ncbi:hypothetical protein BD309DRAFT_1023877 [Dichomitus squalens]|uniref:Uncharacterized protein n=1 Tax=Dichomitus squalens TaxID=114155 RepID=A0A4Q9PHJ0_9APHY|nr:hypothetical protein BD309DRAFT_1023877 [Dichomitus squalens]TBU52386.1 hypothetical protein BD310DRAFT_981900 [Dichomitus squalens]